MFTTFKIYVHLYDIQLATPPTSLPPPIFSVRTDLAIPLPFKETPPFRLLPGYPSL